MYSLSNIAFLFARYDDDGNKCCIVFRFFLSPFSLASLSISLIFVSQLLFAFAIACLYIRQCSNWHTLPFNPNRNWDCRKRKQQQKNQPYVTSTYAEKLIYYSPIFFNRSLSPFGSKQMQIWISAIHRFNELLFNRQTFALPSSV